MSSLDYVVTARVESNVRDDLDFIAKEQGKTRAEYLRYLLSTINPIKDGKTFYLLDYENVPVFNYDTIEAEAILFAFIGNTQHLVSYDLAAKIHEMRDRAKLIKIASSTPNALDFHISFYVGKLSEKYPNSTIRIISKDRGYDAMIDHAKSMGVVCERDATFSDTDDKRYISDYSDDAIRALKNQTHALPTSTDSLVNFLQCSCFKDKSRGFVSLVVQSLKDTKTVTEKLGRLNYRL